MSNATVINWFTFTHSIAALRSYPEHAGRMDIPVRDRINIFLLQPIQWWMAVQWFFVSDYDSWANCHYLWWWICLIALSSIATLCNDTRSDENKRADNLFARKSQIDWSLRIARGALEQNGCLYCWCYNGFVIFGQNSISQPIHFVTNKSIASVSDSCASNKSADTSGPRLRELVAANFDAQHAAYVIIPDDLDTIEVNGELNWESNGRQ